MKRFLLVCLVFFMGIFSGIVARDTQILQAHLNAAPTSSEYSLANEWYRLAAKQGIKEIAVLTESCDVRIEYQNRTVKCIGPGHGEVRYNLIKLETK